MQKAKIGEIYACEGWFKHGKVIALLEDDEYPVLILDESGWLYQFKADLSAVIRQRRRLPHTWSRPAHMVEVRA